MPPNPNPRPALLIRLTHTGLMPDGRVNTNAVLINDLDVGYEHQHRKVPCYVPVGGFIDIPGSSRSLLSYEQGTIRKFHQVGVIIAQMFFSPEMYQTLNRPSAGDYPSGTYIWNETEHAPNYADGFTWVSLAPGGPPSPHSSSHATLGTDPLIIDASIATNNLSTTGLTVNNSTAVTSVTDPGHIHALTDPGHTHTANSATAVNNAILLTGWYGLNSIEADDTAQGLLGQNAASSTPTAQPGVPRVMNVTFPAGWVGGTVTINGTGRNGSPLLEVFTMPLGGGTVAGVKPFFSVVDYANSAPSGGAGVNATISLGEGYGVPHANVVTFLKVSIDGVADTFGINDPTNGVFDPVGAHHGNHGIDVWYTYTLNLTQSSHTHTLSTDQTGASATTHTTGVTVADSGHTHSTTDAGHNHSQTSHDHTISY
jgi:hypothetical protein